VKILLFGTKTRSCEKCLKQELILRLAFAAHQWEFVECEANDEGSRRADSYGIGKYPGLVVLTDMGTMVFKSEGNVVTEEDIRKNFYARRKTDVPAAENRGLPGGTQ
jgi:hypothetical protein